MHTWSLPPCIHDLAVAYFSSALMQIINQLRPLHKPMGLHTGMTLFILISRMFPTQGMIDMCLGCLSWAVSWAAESKADTRSLLIQGWAMLPSQSDWENWQETISSQSQVTWWQSTHDFCKTHPEQQCILPCLLLSCFHIWSSPFFPEEKASRRQSSSLAPCLLTVCPNKPWSAEYYVLLSNHGDSEKTLPNSGVRVVNFKRCH